MRRGQQRGQRGQTEDPNKRRAYKIKEALERALKADTSEAQMLVLCETLSKCTHSSNDECECVGGVDKAVHMEIFNGLFKVIMTLVHVGILYLLDFPTHMKKSKRYGFNLYNTAAWRSIETPREIFVALVKFVQDKGLSIYERNDFTKDKKKSSNIGDKKLGETALESVLLNTKLSEEELNFRYMTIASVPSDHVTKIMNSIMNKIGKDKDNNELLWRARHALCIDHATVIEVLSKAVLMGKNPEACVNLISFILTIFPGADSQFKNLKCGEPSLALFFKLNVKPLPTAVVLLDMFFEKTRIMAFEDASENKDLSQLSFAVMFGCLAARNLFVPKYVSFVMSCLNQAPVGSLEQIDARQRVMMAIKTVTHAKKINPDISAAFTAFPKIDGFISQAIETLIAKKPMNSPAAPPGKSTKPAATVKSTESNSSGEESDDEKFATIVDIATHGDDIKDELDYSGVSVELVKKWLETRQADDNLAKKVREALSI